MIKFPLDCIVTEIELTQPLGKTVKVLISLLHEGKLLLTTLADSNEQKCLW